MEQLWVNKIGNLMVSSVIIFFTTLLFIKFDTEKLDLFVIFIKIVLLFLMFLVVNPNKNLESNPKYHLNIAKYFHFIIPITQLLLINSNSIYSAIFIVFSLSFYPGFLILRCIKKRKTLNVVEKVLIGFSLSYLVSAIISYFLIIFELTQQRYTIPAVFLLLGVISEIIKRRSEKKYTVEETTLSPMLEMSRIEWIGLLICMIFYIGGILVIYPDFSRIIGADISRHYALIQMLIRDSQILPTLNYILFDLFNSSIFLSSNLDFLIINNSTIFLNLLIPISIFAFSKRLFQKSTKLPIIITLFFTFFSSFYNLSWIFYEIEKVNYTGLSQFELFEILNGYFNSAFQYSLFGFWYIPLTVSIILLFTFLMIIFIQIPKRGIFATIVIFEIFMSHVIEATFIIAIFLIFYLVYPNREEFLDILIATIISSITSALFYFINLVFKIFLISPGLSQYLAILAPVFLGISVIIATKKFPSFDYTTILTKIKLKRKTLKIVLIIVYVFVLFSFSTKLNIYKISSEKPEGSIQWFDFSLMGLNILFSILTFNHLIDTAKYKEPKWIFLGIFTAFSFVFAKIITFLNENFFNTGYFESRIMFFFNIGLLFYSGYGFLLIIKRIKQLEIKISTQHNIQLLLISCIILLNFTIVPLNFVYWNQFTTFNSKVITDKELKAVYYMESLLDQDPYRFIITSESRDMGIADYTGCIENTNTYLLYNTPERFLTELYRNSRVTDPIVYLGGQGMKIVEEHLGDRYTSLFTKSLQKVYSDYNISIYNLTKPSPPLRNSTNAMIDTFYNPLPNEYYKFASLFLASNFAEFTIIDDNQDISDYDNLFIDFDPIYQNTINLSNHNLENWNFIGSFEKINDSRIRKNNSELLTLNSPINLKNLDLKLKFQGISNNAEKNQIKFQLYTEELGKTIYTIEFVDNGYMKFFKNGLELITEPVSWNQTNMDFQMHFSDFENQVLINTLNITNSAEFPYTIINFGILGLNGLEIELDNIEGEYYSSLEFSELKQFSENGGNLFVFNSNGYGLFSKIQDFEEYNLSYIENGKKLESFAGKSANFSVLDEDIISTYITENNDSIPFIFHQKMNQGNVFYFNIYPIVNLMKQNNSFPLYSIFGNLDHQFEIPLLDEKLLLDYENYTNVDYFYLSNTNITSDSIRYPINQELQKIELKFTNGTNKYLEDVILLRLNRTNKDTSFRFRSTEVFTNNGMGFFIQFATPGNHAIDILNNPCEVSGYSNKVFFSFSDVYEINVITTLAVSVELKSPHVESGSAYFEDINAPSGIGSLSFERQKNWNTKGYCAFDMRIGDYHYILENVYFSQPVLEYGASTSIDEPETELHLLIIVESTPFIILLLSTIYFFLSKTKSKEE